LIKNFTAQLKTIPVLLFILLLGTCTSQKPFLSRTFSQQVTASENTTISYTLTPNSQLEIFKDNLKETAIKLVKGNKIVIKIEAIRKSPKNVADAGYREILYLEIPNKQSHIITKNLADSNIRVWFARYCFCRDYLGFYKIADGNFELELKPKTLKIKSEIKFNNLPQVLKFIDQKLVLK
jgi:hypothetical protein